MVEFERLTDIVENGYCMGCGLCTQVVEPGAIEASSRATVRAPRSRPSARRQAHPTVFYPRVGFVR